VTGLEIPAERMARFKTSRTELRLIGWSGFWPGKRKGPVVGFQIEWSDTG